MKNTDSAKGNQVSEGASSTPGAVDTTEKGTGASAEPQIVPEVVVGHGDERESEPYTPGEIVEPKANWPVFLLSALGIAIIVAWATIAPDNAYDTLGSTTGWIANNLGWFYILTATICVVFVLGVALSRAGAIRLGPDHARPEYRLFSWSAMLFAAGIGVDLMFFAVAEPVTQYYAPPVGAGETREAAENAVVYALFHYGVTGWAMYALMGMAFGYYAYRLNMPLAIRSALYPLIGKRIHGPVGNAVDIAAMLGTVFGIATSLGIGVVQLNYGLKLLFGWDEGPTVQIALVTAAVGVATLSAVSGVDKGIKRLSEFNVILAITLAVYIVVSGQTAFLFDALIMNIGDYVTQLPSMSMDTYAFSETPEETKEWLGAWTLFFWAWWVAWAPFVGLFLARISRGRTLRQFVFGVLTVPFLFILGWMSFFGNTALSRVIGGDSAFGEAAVAEPQRGFYDLLASSPGATFLVGLSTMVGLLLYITSADSGALVMSNFTSKVTDSRQDGPVWSRIFWAVLVGVLTIVLLQINGVETVQNATVVMGLPFAIVMYFIMLGLIRSLKLETIHNEARSVSIHAAMSGRSSGEKEKGAWLRRLSRASTWPGAKDAQKFMSETARPALQDVAEQFNSRGLNATLVSAKVPGIDVKQLDLTVTFDEEQSFRYQIYPVELPVPTFTRSTSDGSVYYRLEVFDLMGSMGFDVYGYTQEQIKDNIMDLYERHLEFIHIQRNLPGTSDHSDGAEPVRAWTDDPGLAVDTDEK
ncbi:choline BCCT transporter BetT [Corynebacterium sp. UMB9976]|uniref:choline BCCT transporter BetT n=1 Tax=Corynebacterium sp. UMB9976 TaxID=3046354 RepID=UPI00254FBAFC|nr:choline BCCT transporter BetT [Corynebacterium sp. UMB9976]MDK6301267.1 choline BCCT transporter BetT [Corynebacterium sp. UMB9976]